MCWANIFHEIIHRLSLNIWNLFYVSVWMKCGFIRFANDWILFYLNVNQRGCFVCFVTEVAKCMHKYRSQFVSLHSDKEIICTTHEHLLKYQTKQNLLVSSSAVAVKHVEQWLLLLALQHLLFYWLWIAAQIPVQRGLHTAPRRLYCSYNKQ